MRGLRLLILFGSLVACFAGCSEGVDPTLGTEQVFTIWGALDPTADQQAFRIVPIQGAIDADPSEIDAEVTVTDLASGEAVVFRDSFVTFETGATGHVFVADWTPQFDGAYRLEARRTADGVTATADVETPPRISGTIGEAVSTPEGVTYPFAFAGAPNVFGIRMELDVTGLPSAPADTSVLEIQLPESRRASGQIEVGFVSAVRAHLADTGLDGRSLILVGARLVAFVANAEWDVPTGRFDDLDRLVEPGTISNVRGGFGFVGAGYETRVSWLPSVTTQVRAGLGSSEVAAAQLRINEVSTEQGWVELYNPTNDPIAIGNYAFSDAPIDGALTVVPSETVVPAREYAVLDLTFPVLPPSALYFISPSGALVSERTVVEVEPGQTYGSYPDGRSLIVRTTYTGPRDEPMSIVQDLMGGGLFPSRGAPNEPFQRFAVLNELYTEGAGWAEVLTSPPSHRDWSVKSVRVLSRTENMLEYPGIGAVPVLGLAVASEDGARGLDLEQGGGEVFVLVGYVESPDPRVPTYYRVMDYRRYGLQTPGRSEGRLPDGGRWEQGLVPTRGAPNPTGAPLARR